MSRTKLLNGNNIELLKTLPENSIDSIVTDPPYGLSFMGKKWDYDVPSVEFWKEVFRVLKPGGHVLSFGGTRTYHRMVVNMEDAGFEIRDQIMWLYGSGFPKSLNIGKAVDKIQGNEGKRGDIKRGGERILKDGYTSEGNIGWKANKRDAYTYIAENEFEGWGTALKPANEPICLARKPLSEKSVAENVLKWKTGGINVDGCRVGSDIIETTHNPKITGKMGQAHGEQKGYIEGQNTSHEGRFPANIILECCCDEVIKGEKGEVKKTTRNRVNEAGGGIIDKKEFETSGIDNYNDKGDIHTNPNCPCYVMDSQSGISITNHKGKRTDKGVVSEGVTEFSRGKEVARTDKGGASRFFYQAKVSKKERNMGLDHFEDKEIIDVTFNSFDEDGNRLRMHPDGTTTIIKPIIRKNTHPTVKPVSLMAYLCRMITPEGGIVLDPFMGSGSTGIAAQLEGFKFCGMEMDGEYFKIAQSRIENFESYREFIKK